MEGNIYDKQTKKILQLEVDRNFNHIVNKLFVLF